MHDPAVHVGKVYLVDDSIDVCRHTGSLLRCAGYDVVTFVDESDFLSALPRLNWPAVVILDMRMPKLSGLELQAALQKLDAPCTIIFMSGESERPDIVKAMKEGALDFLLKPASLTELRCAIDEALEKANQISRASGARNQLRSIESELSEREKIVLSLMLDGMANLEISTHLNIQAGTVKKHRANICEKFGVARTSEIITLFRKAGVTSPTSL